MWSGRFSHAHIRHQLSIKYSYDLKPERTCIVIEFSFTLAETSQKNYEIRNS